jgi:pimeloyl-ACP methyl ester carboxylesterase
MHRNRSSRTTPRRTALILCVVLAALVMMSSPATADVSKRAPRGPHPTIVLVHGAFADASGWNPVIERLQGVGYDVIAPANPLRGLAADAAYVRSVLDTIDGPVVLVGHSYGGAVITNAAAGHPKVKALVYVAAFAPAEGDSLGSLQALNPGSLLGPDALVFRPHAGGVDGYIDPARFRRIFAADLPRDTAAVMAASQRPGDVATLSDASGPPAWATVPSWYLVARDDRVIPAATQRFMAERAGATVTEVRSSHVAMISHPRRTTDLIGQAARAVR